MRKMQAVEGLNRDVGLGPRLNFEPFDVKVGIQLGESGGDGAVPASDVEDGTCPGWKEFVEVLREDVYTTREDEAAMEF